jgi:hypothetical protein
VWRSFRHDTSARSRLPWLLGVLAAGVVGALWAQRRRATVAAPAPSRPTDEEIDDAIAQSFPASDPPSWSGADARTGVHE